MGGASDSLVVMLADDLADGGRKAALGFGVALAAVSRGTQVHVFLLLECAKLGTPTGADGLRPRGFSDSLAQYIEHFLDLGGKLEVCSSCYEEYCRHSPKDEHGRPQLRAGTSIHGLGVIAERAGSMPVIAF